jgi:hypothetical protein
MTESNSWVPDTLGTDLMKLRDKAGLSQKALGERLGGVDASRISRIEGGTVKLGAVELDKYLQKIDSELSTAYREYLLRDWKRFPKPPFWHPNRTDLGMADDALARLEELAANLPPTSPLLPQLDMHRQALKHAACYLEAIRHDIVFIGETGVGKSFGLSCLSRLVMDRPDVKKLADRMVLEVGSGGTTLCEIEIRKGPNYGLIVYPQPKEEVQILVTEFLKGLSDDSPEEETSEENRGRLSEEVDRALRNLMDLKRVEEEGPDGKIVETDPALQLKARLSRAGELQAELFARMRYDERQTTQLWHETETPGMPALEWLKSVFQEVNNGLRADVPLPRKIDLVVPYQPLKAKQDDDDHLFDIHLIDSKGLDKTAIREDIQARMDDPRSILVLCTQFNALAGSIEGLLKHARDTGAKTTVNTRTVLLALPKNDEAVSMKTAARRPVESDEQGYVMNGRRRKAQLEGLNAERVPILHLNATRSSDVQGVTEQLIDTIKTLRQSYVTKIAEIDTIVRDLVQNHEKAVSKAAHDKVRHQLEVLLKRLSALPERDHPIYMKLLAVMRSVHPRTLQASVTRHGEWDNLNVYLHLGSGAAADAQTRSMKFFAQLEGLIEQLLADESLAAAHGFLRQLSENAQLWREGFLETTRRKGKGLLRPSLHDDNDLWKHCASIHGSGYRNAVTDTIQQEGLEVEQRTELLDVLESNVQEDWDARVIDQFRKLCGI